MWIGEVELPAGVLEAQREGRLVVFAGAGVSAPRPSSIPTFAAMVATIRDESALTRRKSEPFDAMLGRVNTSGYLVHQRVDQIVRSAGSPNGLHHAIVGLFRDPAQLRIVTTNFDRLLSVAAEARWPGPVQEYVAPALPLGDDASGIVYLHGAIGHDPKRLVLTDADFGRAYLTQGHARRFLVQLFSSNVVLFVGYSHRDTVLTYLARGLPPRVEPRFAFTEARDVDRWAALSIEPIVYATRRGRPRHRALQASLGEWGRYIAMGFGDHRREMAEIISRGPGLDRQSLDYLRARLNDPDTVRYFCEEASDLAWLEWIAAEPVFQAAMCAEESGHKAEVYAALAWWFAEKFASSHPTEARVAVARLGRGLSPTAWAAVARRLWIERPSADDFSAWLPILLASAPDRSGDILDYLLAACRPGDDDRAAILLFDFLTDPMPVVERVAGAFTEDGRETARVDVQVRGDGYWLAENYVRVFRGRMDTFARPLLGIVSHHLDKAHAIFRAGGQTTDFWDPTSFRRAAIEPHEQDRHGSRAWWDVAVDAGRDALEWAAEKEPALARSFVDQWVGSPAPLLRRLAVHAAGRAPWMDPDARLALMVEHRILFSTSAHHEVYGLIAEAYGPASDAMRRELLSAVDDGPVEPRIAADPHLAAKVRYDLLQWLSQVAPADAEVRGRLEAILALMPELQPSAHPDLLTWTEAGIFVPPSPVAADELRGRDPSDTGVLDWLLTLEAGAGGFDLDPFGRRRSVLEGVASVASSEATWGLTLATALRDRSEWASDLWDALAESWGEAKLTDDQWGQVLDLLLEHKEPNRHTTSFARLLEVVVRSSPPQLPIRLLSIAEAVAVVLWKGLLETASEGAVIEDWLERAVNDPAGQLAMFFIRSLTAMNSSTGRQELGSGSKAIFESMLMGETQADALARAVVASQVHLFHRLDREWTLNVLLPVFSWSAGPTRVRQVWDGFLTWGRLDPSLVDDLLPMYESAFAHLSTLGHLRDRFAEHLSAVAFLTSRGPVDTGWLLRFARDADRTDVEKWARFVTDQLAAMTDEARELAWSRWIRPYWRRRLEGNPRALSTEEARAMAEWPLQLPTVFEEAAQHVCAGPAAGFDGQFFYSLARTDLPERHPTGVTRLTRHVLSGQERSAFWHCDDAVRIGHRVAASPLVRGADIEALVEKLLRLNCPGAEEIRRGPEDGPTA